MVNFHWSEGMSSFLSRVLLKLEETTNATVKLTCPRSITHVILHKLGIEPWSWNSHPKLINTIRPHIKNRIYFRIFPKWLTYNDDPFDDPYNDDPWNRFGLPFTATAHNHQNNNTNDEKQTPEYNVIYFLCCQWWWCV